MAPKVPLPPDLATAFGTKRNPVAHHVRTAFRRNRADTSPRLVYPALQAGYRMLALLSRAAATATTTTTQQAPASTTSSSPEHAAIESFLRARLAERNATLAAKEVHPPNSRNPLPPTSAPREGTRPLLVKISPPATPSNPFPVPEYATPHRPLPQSELGSTGSTQGQEEEEEEDDDERRPPGRWPPRRQIPRLEMAGDFPFLRLTKPQPALLSRVLHQKNKKRVERIAAWTQFKEEDMLDAQEEDAWERTLARNPQYSLEGCDHGRPDETYEATVRQHGLQHLSDVLNQEREDSVARADAMRDLIRAETALRDQEEEARRLERRRWWEESQKKEEEMQQQQQKAKKNKTSSPNESEAKPQRPSGRPRKSSVGSLI